MLKSNHFLFIAWAFLILGFALGIVLGNVLSIPGEVRKSVIFGDTYTTPDEFNSTVMYIVWIVTVFTAPFWFFCASVLKHLEMVSNVSEE